MLKSTDQTVMHSYPGLVALVTANDGDTQNIMAAGWHSYISYSPAIYGVAVAKERFTHHLIEKSKSFAINFVAAEHAYLIEGSGKLTGANGNKFEQLKATWKKGETVSAPILDVAYVAYECEVMDIQTYGDHDWIVGKITKFHKDESKFGDDRLPNFNELKIPLYLGQSKYLIGDKTCTIEQVELKK
ncbi:flavin reductase family protein [Evansella sp. AB-rgal1]|uniref:flavin reductase family protein n=1 Tax=Evansella sp. AB-rgal1 TaxID=3242696 RepID=UPI00359E2B56